MMRGEGMRKPTAHDLVVQRTTYPPLTDVEGTLSIDDVAKAYRGDIKTMDLDKWSVRALAKEPFILTGDPIEISTTVITFQHIFLSQPAPTDKPPRHNCLASGYFCLKNLKEYPGDIFSYLANKKRQLKLLHRR